MKIIDVENQQVKIWNIHDFPYKKFVGVPTIRKDKKTSYADIICAFDIEITTMSVEECDVMGKDFGFMYCWQFAIHDEVVMGRTWEEYIEFIDNLKYYMDIGSRKLIVFCHFLEFEFQFMRNFFKVDKVFAVDKRKVVYAIIEDIEYRCSFKLTNMGLQKLCQKTPGVTFGKRDGKAFNYSKKRYPDTPLTNLELGYCVCDVLGLVQALENRMEDDTLATLPITSTGYVRREYREKCLAEPNYRNKYFLSKQLNPITYTLCREGSRGAISGSSHLHTDEILYEVDSFDIKSSYPYNMCTQPFPSTKFIQVRCKYGTEKFYKLLNDFCCLITWSVKNHKQDSFGIRLKSWQGIPYISKAKCRAIEGERCGNGKVFWARKLGMVCTEIDFKIIETDYKLEDVTIHDMWIAQKELLPLTFREHLLEMFQYKTDLEDGDKYLYNKYKNKINASFGMMVTDITRPEIVYCPTNEQQWLAVEPELSKALKRYYHNKKSFLSYQDGVWVLAHARSCLHTGMQIVGSDLVQVDTDSVKTLGDYKKEFKELNKIIINDIESNNTKAYSIKNGKKHYLGVWEHEDEEDGKSRNPTYKEFKTLGAKKYAVKKWGHDEIEITVAGLSKEAGAWFDKHGGLSIFTHGTKLPYEEDGRTVSGRTSSLYNDYTSVYKVSIQGHEVTLGSNIAVSNIEYTLGMTSEWLLLILDGKLGENEAYDLEGAYKGWI